MKLTHRLDFTEEDFTEAMQHLHFLAHAGDMQKMLPVIKENIRVIIKRIANSAFDLGVSYGRSNPENKS
jgi:hypothetical protein